MFLKGTSGQVRAFWLPFVPALRCRMWAPAEAVGVRRLAKGLILRF